jgi:hypothetical protein
MLHQKFRWLILLAYAMARSDFGEIVGERIQDLIGGLRACLKTGA